MKVNEVFLLILMGVLITCALLGGFETVWSIIDLLQLLSYLKFINVDYPANIVTYFEFMGRFNF
jgi:hypothetical protein